MKRPVLIITASLELGDLICKSLAETYQFDAYHYRDEESAVAFLQTHRDCSHVLIETALGEARVAELGLALRRIKHSIKLILMSRTMPSGGIDQIHPWSLLRQPFLLPDLLAALDAVTPTVIDVRPVQPSSPKQLNWLDDPALAAQTLERLAAASNIEGVILLRKYDLWAYAGRLSQETVTEIKDLVLRNIDSEQQFDLLQYMRLGTRDDQHGLWAKLVLVNVILAVIYDLSTSFSEMRMQTNALAEALARPVRAQLDDGTQHSIQIRNHSSRSRRRRSKTRSLSKSSNWRQSDLFDAYQTGHEIPELPQQEPYFDGDELPVSGRNIEEEQFFASAGMPVVSRESHSLIRYPGLPPDDSNNSLQSNQRLPVGRMRLRREEPDSFEVPGISYSCLLTPRFETHQLTGDLAEIIRVTLPRVCISYGCRLEFMEVKEDCLHWAAVLPPTKAIADHIQTVRLYTSAHVFETFSEYLKENFSRDFWAPGYSVLAGAQGHTEQEIRAFVLSYRGGQHYYGIRPALDFDPSA